MTFRHDDCRVPLSPLTNHRCSNEASRCGADADRSTLFTVGKEIGSQEQGSEFWRESVRVLSETSSKRGDRIRELPFSAVVSRIACNWRSRRPTGYGAEVPYLGRATAMRPLTSHRSACATIQPPPPVTPPAQPASLAWPSTLATCAASATGLASSMPNLARILSNVPSIVRAKSSNNRSRAAVALVSARIRRPVANASLRPTLWWITLARCAVHAGHKSRRQY